MANLSKGNILGPARFRRGAKLDEQAALEADGKIQAPPVRVEEFHY
jgi:hypothetical protein